MKHFKSLLLVSLNLLFFVDSYVILNKDFYTIHKSLERVLQSLHENIKVLNLDAFLGLTIANSQLDAALKMSTKKHQMDLLKVSTKLSLIGKEMYEQNLRKDSNMAKGVYSLVDLMEDDSKSTHTQLKIEVPFVTHHIPIKNKLDLIYYMEFTNNTPTAVQSDFCISELFANNQKKRCRMSNKCDYLIYGNPLENSRGYSLTHRLLYHQLYTKKCAKPSAEIFTWKLCNKMYAEVNLIARKDLDFIYRDLFMEEILLCGLEDYDQFFAFKWIFSILSWQSPTGCFTMPMEQIPRNIKEKRNDSSMIQKNCRTHISGLGAAVLSMILKKIVERE